MGQICVRGKGQIYVRGGTVAVKGEPGGRAFAAIARRQRGRGGAGKGSGCGMTAGSRGSGRRGICDGGRRWAKSVFGVEGHICVCGKEAGRRDGGTAAVQREQGKGAFVAAMAPTSLASLESDGPREARGRSTLKISKDICNQKHRVHPCQAPRRRLPHTQSQPHLLQLHPSPPLDDGTGCFPCVRWLNHLHSPRSAAAPSDLRVLTDAGDGFARRARLGALVRVRGRPGVFRGELQVTVADVVAEPDPNAELFHWLLCIKLAGERRKTTGRGGCGLDRR